MQQDLRGSTEGLDKVFSPRLALLWITIQQLEKK